MARATFNINRCQALIDNLGRWIGCFFQPLRIFVPAFHGELAYFRIIQPGVQLTLLPLKLALSGGHMAALFNGGAVFSRHYQFYSKCRGGGNGIPVRDRSGRERDQRVLVEITQRLLWCAAVMVSLIMSGVGLGFTAATSWKTGFGAGYFCS